MKTNKTLITAYYYKKNQTRISKTNFHNKKDDFRRELKGNGAKVLFIITSDQLKELFKNGVYETIYNKKGYSTFKNASSKNRYETLEALVGNYANYESCINDLHVL